MNRHKISNKITSVTIVLDCQLLQYCAYCLLCLHQQSVPPCFLNMTWILYLFGVVRILYEVGGQINVVVLVRRLLRHCPYRLLRLHHQSIYHLLCRTEKKALHQDSWIKKHTYNTFRTVVTIPPHLVWSEWSQFSFLIFIPVLLILVETKQFLFPYQC